jgi:hypothetical protein
MSAMKSGALSLDALLFDGEPANVFVILDGASIPVLLDKLYADPAPTFECLYRGDLEPDMAEVAPYVVLLDRDSPFFKWVATGWGKHWGVFAKSAAPMRPVRNHLRGLVTAYQPDGTPMRFRYYDPRVLRTHLPNCDARQLQGMFGPIAAFVLEDEDPAVAAQFSLEDGLLQKRKFELTNV